MQATPEHWPVERVLELRRNNLLDVDPEYQRGHVWTRVQQQFFVDSILRGYHVPLFYFHVQKGKQVGSLQTGDRLFIVDGQQRLQALWAFAEGAFKLLDPREHVGRFPQALANASCPWAGRDIHRLDTDTKREFLETELSIVQIETDDHTEVRDLFIRLQGGIPLTPQEQRDAWPGQFGAFVCRIAGKEGIEKYPGHDFFLELMCSPTNAKNPKARQLAAQMIMLFDRNIRDGEFCDIHRRAVDAYYIKNLGFDLESSLASEFSSVLDTVTRLLSDGKRPAMVGHQAIHSVLLARALSDGSYVRSSWEPKFAEAFDHFNKCMAESRAKERNDRVADEYMRNYGYKTRAGSDIAGNIRDRQMLFNLKMMEYMQPTSKDQNRIFGAIERELIYHRDEKRCRAPDCGKEVLWGDAQFHHVEPYGDGGATSISNGALVHRECHPRSAADVQQFADHFWRSGRHD